MYRMTRPDERTKRIVAAVTSDKGHATGDRMKRFCVGRRRLVLGAPIAVAAGVLSPFCLAEHTCIAEGSGQSCDAKIKTGAFSRVSATQKTLLWCWAATLEMIFRWKGKNIRQEDIVIQTFGSAQVAAANPIVLINAVNRTYRDRSGASFSVSARIWGPDFGVAQIDNGTLISSLSAERPLVVCNTSHMMALVGINYLRFGGAIQVRQAWVADPMISGSVTDSMGAMKLAPGFRYLFPPEMIPVTIGGQLRFVADLAIS
jgi:hypothetical protein